MKEYIDFLFEDTETSEEFLVEVENTPNARREAIEIAKEVFENPILIRRVSVEEAERMGLDTY